MNFNSYLFSVGKSQTAKTAGTFGIWGSFSGPFSTDEPSSRDQEISRCCNGGNRNEVLETVILEKTIIKCPGDVLD
jgi:hypothetical protein